MGLTPPQLALYEEITRFQLLPSPSANMCQACRGEVCTGMRSLFDADPPPATADRRMLPLGIRRAIAELKAEYPAFGPFEIARICQHRFDRAVSYHTVQ